VKEGNVTTRALRYRKQKVQESFSQLQKQYKLNGKIVWEEDKDVNITEEEIALIVRRVAKIRDTHNLPLRGVSKILGKAGTNSHAKAHVIQKFIKDVNNEMERDIQKTYDGEVVSVNVKDLLRYLISKTYKDQTWTQLRSLDIKISGDGRNSSRRLPYVLITITIIQSGNLFSDESCYTVALTRSREGREPIESVLRPILQQFSKINTKNGLKINQRRIKLQLYLCADWKFLALVLGLNSANSDWFCLWCLCQKEERPHTTTEWSEHLRSIDNMKGGACTDEKCKRGETGATHTHGVNASCLLSSDIFQLENVILDVLHQRLRVSDVLINGLIEYVTSRKKGHLLTEECAKLNITFEKLKSVNKKTGAAEWTPLDGKEKKKLLESLDLDQLLEGHLRKDKFIKMWQIYNVMDDYLNSEKPIGDDLVIQDVEEYESFAWKFFLLVRKVLGEKKVTPYIHALVYHVPDMLRKHGNIAKFSCSAQELKNKTQTRVLTHQTVNTFTAHQILQQEHRKLWYNENPKAFEGTLQQRKRRKIDAMELYKKSLSNY